MNSVDHVPQTLASHTRLPEEIQPQGLQGGNIMQHGADMLKPDPRDTFYSSKSASHHHRLSPFFCPHPGFLSYNIPHWMSGSLSLWLSLQLCLDMSFRLSGWLYSIFWPPPSFLTPTFVETRILNTYLSVPDLKYLHPPFSLSPQLLWSTPLDWKTFFRPASTLQPM